jgi:hypothetical protein
MLKLIKSTNLVGKSLNIKTEFRNDNTKKHMMLQSSKKELNP